MFSYVRSRILPLMLSVAVVSTAGVATAQDEETTHQEVVRLATAMQLTPTNLVASMSSSQWVAVLARIESSTDQRFEIKQAELSIDGITTSIEELTTELHVDPDNEELLSQLHAAEMSLVAAQTEKAHALQELSVIACEVLTDTARARLATLKLSSARRVPAEFRVMQFDDEEWLVIEKALRAERLALRRNRALNPEYSALLTSIRSQFEVIEAKQELDLRLQSVKESFQQYAASE